MPYLTKVRMRTNCDRGIPRVVCGSGAAGVSRSSGRTVAAGESIGSTRGLRVTGRWSSSGMPELLAC